MFRNNTTFTRCQLCLRVRRAVLKTDFNFIYRYNKINYIVMRSRLEDVIARDIASSSYSQKLYRTRDTSETEVDALIIRSFAPK